MKKLIATSLLVLSSSANAAFLTGNDLLSKLTSETSADRMLAMGYIAGIYDVFEGNAICTGGGVNLGQLKDIVLKKLRAVPELRHEIADNFVYVALTEAFPCKKKKSS